jgi:nitroimidazol reductase NimA-like FMN-containing flavoprotein (pyridoxamine 5'-phosphate oxidase superfamily)
MDEKTISYDPDMGAPNRVTRDEYAMDDDWIESAFLSAEACRVATAWDDQPFITTLNFWFHPDRREIYFHTHITGRLRANIERNPKVCVEVSRHGEFLPAETALEFSVQYEGAVAFGHARLLEDDRQKREALYGLIRKHFPDFRPGQDYALITEEELEATAVYALRIDHWSGKRNWGSPEAQGDQA